jgi:uncharacterized membrane protein YczE
MPRPLARRLPGLLFGLTLFGIGVAVMAQAGLGLGPWEVLHQGISRQSGLALGTVSILVGIPVLAFRCCRSGNVLASARCSTSPSSGR